MSVAHRPVAIFSLTARGRALAARVLAVIPEAHHHHRPQPFGEVARHTFVTGQRGIFICATGIVVRALAPVLTTKHTDPAVIVMDERGDYVIPLLGGHADGGGELAAHLATALGAQCVTTSVHDYARPRYAIGMGCARDCPYEELRALYEQVMRDHGAVPISALASINLKNDEVGLQALAAHLHHPLTTYSPAQLRVVENLLSEKSAAVYRATGCYGVAEAAALCAARDLTNQPPELVIPKQKTAHATIAVARSFAEPVGLK